MSGQNIIITKINHPATTLGNKQTKILQSSKTSSNDVYKKGYLLLEKEAKIDYKSRVLVNVDIGPYGKGVGHDEFTGDAMQIYNLTLMYISTSDKKYAIKAIELQDEWNIKCKSFTGSNAPLECAWGSICMVRAIELLKYMFPEFSKYQTFEERFKVFLKNIIIPNLTNRYNEIIKWNNNWIITIQEALIQIYLYYNDITNVNKIIEDFKKVLPKCIIHECGMCTETKRDLIHTQFQIGSIIQICELCWHQGIDLYKINNNIILSCLEYHANILNGNIPNDVKKDELKDVWFMPSVWDIAHNHFVNRIKIINGMQNIEKLLRTRSNRPEKLTFNWGPAWIHHQSY
jgi:hypothetical protein